MTAPNMLHDALVQTASNRWADAHTAWLGCRDEAPYLSTLVLVDVAVRVGDLDQALQLAETCETFAPNAPFLARLRERATTVLQRRSTFTDVANPEQLGRDEVRKLARTAVECHLWPRAVTLWLAYLERFGPNAEAYKRLATCYQNLGDFPNSILYFREANKAKADPVLVDGLDRVQRLDQRKFDSFSKHVQRFYQLPAFEAAMAASATTPPLNAELIRLSISTGIPLLGAPMGAPSNSAAKPSQPESRLLAKMSPMSQPWTHAPASAVPTPLREVDLDALRTRIAADPAAGFADLPMRPLGLTKNGAEPGAIDRPKPTAGPSPFAPRPAIAQVVTVQASPPPVVAKSSAPTLMSRLKSLTSKS
jgi:hypothetical protein